METVSLQQFLSLFPYPAIQIPLEHAPKSPKSLPKPVWISPKPSFIKLDKDSPWDFLSPPDQDYLAALLASVGFSNAITLPSKKYRVVLTLLGTFWIVVFIPLEDPITQGMRAGKTKLHSQTYSNFTKETVSSKSPFPSTREGIVRSKPCNSLDLEAAIHPEKFQVELGKSKMGVLIRDFDWEIKATLGPIEEWPGALRYIIAFILNHPEEGCIYWGDEATMIYNEKFSFSFIEPGEPVIGVSGFSWWNYVDKEASQRFRWIRNQCLAGECVWGENTHLVIMKTNEKGQKKQREMFKTFCAVPIISEGVVRGCYIISIDTSDGFLSSRRGATIADFWQTTQGSPTLNEFCIRTTEFFGLHLDDLPFIGMYTIQGCHTQIEKGQIHLKRQSAVGFQEPNFLPSKVNFQSKSLETFQHPFVQATYTTLYHDHTSQPDWENLFADAWTNQSIILIEHPLLTNDRPSTDDPVQMTAIFSFGTEPYSVASGILVIGINSRIAYDTSYSEFIRCLGHNIALGMSLAYNTESEASKTEELILMDQAKTSFLTNTSHELWTPLTLILGPLSDTLERQSIDEESKQNLKVVWKNANSLLTMVNKLLDLSLLDSGRMGFNFRAVDIGSLTYSIVSNLTQTMARENIKFIVDAPQDSTKYTPVYLVPELYEKILYNLLGNALKYCPVGTIKVLVESSTTEAIITVSDTGIGIPESDIPHVFERYYRSPTNASTRKGSGIGLSLVMEVLKVLQGSIELNSIEGEGTTFKVHLRRGHEHINPQQVSHESYNASDYTSLLTHKHNISAMLGDAVLWEEDIMECPPASDFIEISNEVMEEPVVVVDDSLKIRSHLNKILRKKFKNVLLFENCQSALDYCLKEPPALILTDIMTPRLSGYEFLQRIRSNDATKLVPFIFLSAISGIDVKIEALEKGADDYLVKPFSSRELLARTLAHVQAGLARKELEREVLLRTKELQQSESLCRTLVHRYTALNETTPIGIFMLGRDGGIHYSNTAYERMVGVKTPAKRSEWLSCVSEQDLPHITTLINQITEGKLPVLQDVSVDLTYTTGVSCRVYSRTVDSSLQSQDIVLVGCITDVTAERKLEELQRQAAEQRIQDSEESRRQQERFIDVASHELRNPLSGVWQNAECLKDSISSYKAFIEEHLHMIKDQDNALKMLRQLEDDLQATESILLCAAHQSRIANDILNVSKLSIGLLEISPVHFDLCSKVQDTLKMFETDCRAKSIRLTLEKGPRLKEMSSLVVQADPARIAQVLINIISNAVKYTIESLRKEIVVILEVYEVKPASQPHVLRIEPIEQFEQHELPTIEEQDCLWASISVQDSGKGIAPKGMRKMFKRFSQVNPKTDSAGGAGLGLYISKKLIHLHRGFMEVSSNEDTGSLFRVVFPSPRVCSFVASPKGIGLPITHIQSNEPEQAGKKRKASTDLSRHRILIVEDNIINQKVLRRQLEMHHMQVTSACNGREGLDKILEAESLEVPFDAVIMDVEMPVMTGLEAIKELRKLEKINKISRHYRVVALTGNARQGQIDESRRAGFDEVFLKPYDIASLIQYLCSPPDK